MAINTQKLLAPSTSSGLVLKNKTISAASLYSDTSTSNSSGTYSKKFVELKVKVIEIDKILKGTLAIEKKTIDDSRKKTEQEKREKKEKLLEKTPEEKKQSSKLTLPKISFFDRIKEFFANILLGFVLTKLVDLAEYIEPFLPAIKTTFDWISNFVVGIVDGLGTFLAWGQSVVDSSKEFLEEHGGEEALERFNQLGNSLFDLFNAILIVGAAQSLLRDPKKPGRNLRGKPGTGSGTGSGTKPTAAQRTRNARIRSIQRKHGPAARKIYENALNNGKTPSQASAAVKRELGRRITSRPGADSLSAKSAPKGNVLKGGLSKAPGKLGLKLFGKQGVKLVSKTFGKIPVMGPLIVAVASLLAGEPMGKAVFKGIGAALGGLLGSFIPIPVIGTILGETIGVLVGDMMYSLLFEGKEGVANAGKKFMNALKTALDVGGLILNFFKEGFGRFFNDFPTVDVSDAGWGALQIAMAKVFPFLDKDGDGKVGKLPDFSILFDPLKMITKLIPHAAASFLPAIFGEGGSAFGGDKKAPKPDSLSTQDEKTTGKMDTRSTGEGSNLAGEAGNFIESKLSSPNDYQAITEHPDFGGIKGRHATNSYHYHGRAIDIGAYSHEQGPIVDVINQFNKMKGVSPAELITAQKDPSGHGDHVHVAYEKGGMTLDHPHIAKIAEKGKEIVIDNDSSVTKAAPMLLAINDAKDEKGVMKAISDYAPYEILSSKVIIIEKIKKIKGKNNYDSKSSPIPVGNSIINNDPFEFLDYQG